MVLAQKSSSIKIPTKQGSLESLGLARIWWLDGDVILSSPSDLAVFLDHGQHILPTLDVAFDDKPQEVVTDDGLQIDLLSRGAEQVRYRNSQFLRFLTDQLLL